MAFRTLTATFARAGTPVLLYQHGDFTVQFQGPVWVSSGCLNKYHKVLSSLRQYALTTF